MSGGTSGGHRPPDDATQRFADRVDAYVAARPGYPPAAVDVLRERAGLRPGAVVADLGAGTGIFTRLLLDAGATVHAVEPNGPMLAALERDLGGTPGLHLHEAPAEATGLPDGAADLATAAQAFHWFDRSAVARELRRVLRPGGAVALVWNTREVGGTPFLDAYEALLRRWGTDYATVEHRNVTRDAIEGFLAGPDGPGRLEVHTTGNHQDLDLDGLRTRLLSSSYAPAPGHPDHEPMLTALTEVFRAHARDGVVRLAYRTETYLGWFG